MLAESLSKPQQWPILYIRFKESYNCWTYFNLLKTHFRRQKNFVDKNKRYRGSFRGIFHQLVWIACLHIYCITALVSSISSQTTALICFPFEYLNKGWLLGKITLNCSQTIDSLTKHSNKTQTAWWYNDTMIKTCTKVRRIASQNVVMLILKMNVEKLLRNCFRDAFKLPLHYHNTEWNNVKFKWKVNRLDKTLHLNI